MELTQQDAWWARRDFLLACHYSGEIGPLCGGPPRVTYTDPVEVASRLQSIGVNAVLAVLSIGEGRAFEAEQRRHFSALAEALHARGCRIIAYMKGMTTTYSFLDEVPEAEDWLFRQEDGSIRHCFREDVHRYFVCPTSPWFPTYFRRAMADALEAGADGVFLDNLGLSALCYCARCREEFRAFCEQRAGRAVDYGRHDGVSPESALVHSFRKHLLTRIYDEADRARRGLGRPDLPIVTSPSYPLGSGFEMRRFSNIVNLYEGNPDLVHRISLTNSSYYSHRGIPFDSIVISRVQEMSTAQALEFTLGENLFYNQRGIIPYAFWMDMEREPGCMESARAYNHFLLEHLAVFERMKTEAGFALYFSHKCADIDPGGYPGAYRGWESCFLDRGAGYTVLFDDDPLPSPEEVGLVILPDAFAMEEAEMDAFQAYVKAGGKLVVTGRAGGCDAGGSPRQQPLPERLGVPAAGPEESLFTDGVVLLRKPADRDYLRLKHTNLLTRYATDEEFIDHQIMHRSAIVLRKALGHFGLDPEVASVSEPAVKLRIYRSGDATVVQFLNYAYPATARDVEVRLRAEMPATLEMRVPGKAPARVAVAREGASCTFRVPELPLYAMLV